MANMQRFDIVGDTALQKVACVIYCCDKKEYSMKKGGKTRQAKCCQRLANRKHSCVLHNLREKPGGKLSTTNRFKSVQASSRKKVRGIKRTLIPDTIINGNEVVDAKFPCDPADLKTKLPLKNKIYPSLSKAGKEAITDKEINEYSKIKGINKVRAMTPRDAAERKNKNCKCETAK